MSETYRDRLATIDQRGKRIWVYPLKPKGRFYSARTNISIFLLSFLFGAPFIKINGSPLLLLDIAHRQFYILGFIFWPQDIYLFVLALISLVVFAVLFTAAFGRLFCGWVCPQTVFLEMVFRKIEHFIEGSGATQKQFDKAHMTIGKAAKKIIKHSIFAALAFIIGNTFLAYFIGIDNLKKIITAPPNEHLTGFILMVLFSSAFYFVFTWFREQACTLVCPYGRLQSVLLDSNSIVVAYDFKRGEPRGPLKTRADNQGDCIECQACVRVCPTGIDIRNGTQLECVNCTACIDACDNTMRKVGFKTGLIKLASYDQIANGGRLKFTPRMKLYSAVFLILISVFTTVLIMRTSVQATILRTSGSLYEEMADGTVRNIYVVKVTNKTSWDLPITLKLEAPAGNLTLLGPALEVEPRGQDESVFSVQIAKTAIFTSNQLLVIGLYSGGKKLEDVRTMFVGPDPGGRR
jgi:cytochrome c oxidase accessory protein FixG